jgi:hypothetical protein
VRRLLRDEGAQTTAIITRVWRAGGKDSRHMVSYRFAAGAADEIDGRSSAPAAIWKGLVPGGSLPVRYVPGRPEINHPAEWESSGAPVWLAWVLFPILAGPAVAFFILIRRQSRLLSEGRPAPGKVTEVKRADKAVIVKYEFSLLSGALMKGKSGGGRRPPGIGSVVCVIYDPDNPRRNAIYPMPLVKLMRS